MKRHKAFFRFFEELNDFLPEPLQKVEFEYTFLGKPSVKDAIEAIGVPHTEVDLIQVNGASVTFNYLLNNKDRVMVYPMFENFDIASVAHLRPKPLRRTKFILDVHLGKLARYLRLLGFDSAYTADATDQAIVDKALAEKRIILTRDKGLLKIKRVTHGYWLRNTDPQLQAIEIIRYFSLKSALNPFVRCTVCNEKLRCVAKSDILQKLPARTKAYYKHYQRCPGCHRIYWQGSHYCKMLNFINHLKKIVTVS